MVPGKRFKKKVINKLSRGKELKFSFFEKGYKGKTFNMDNFKVVHGLIYGGTFITNEGLIAVAIALDGTVTFGDKIEKKKLSKTEVFDILAFPMDRLYKDAQEIYGKMSLEEFTNYSKFILR